MATEARGVPATRTADEVPGGPETAAARRFAPWVLWAYLALDALLVAAATQVPALPSAVILFAVALLGVGGLAMGVYRQRPDAAVGWWLVVAGAGMVAAATAATMASIAATGGFRPDEWLIAALSALAYPLFIAGLAVLARLGGRTGPADMLDATAIALATFLVLFALIIHPVLVNGLNAVVAAVFFPLVTLLMFATAIRVVLGVGVPTVSLALLLLAVGAFVATAVSVMMPALDTGSLQLSPPTQPLWVTYHVLLGAAGLHPSLGRTRRRRQPRHDPVSRWRLVLFAILAVVAPLAWASEIWTATGITHDPIGVIVPLIVSALLLVLLVARLGLIAGVAQRRAGELAERSRDLAAAVQHQNALQRQLRHQAMHDPLTGLFNRVVLAERMEWALTRPTGSRRYALALVDLDRFKDINDTLGHATGDELLVEVSHRLLASTPANGALARLGGDEFAILLEDTLPGEAMAWADRLRESLRQPYRVSDQELFLTASMGLVCTEPTGPTPTPSETLGDADLALHAAKSAGRDRVVEFRPELRTARMDFSRLSTGLQRALARDELAVHYQPVVDLDTRRVVAVEALLRWTPDGRPPIPPSEFIPVAEETGLIAPIGAWVMRRACRDTRGWFGAHGVAVAVNVSARQLDDPNFAGRVIDCLRDAGLPGRALIVEITETSLVATSATGAAMDQLDRLRAHDVRVAIDDFGTGYSSMAYVAHLPVDIVKIDSSFVHNPTRPGAGRQGWAFTRAILHMVDALRLQAVAEGVETLEQAETLRQLRCPLAQGYLFARPMPRKLLEQTLATSTIVTENENAPPAPGRPAPARAARAPST